MAEDALYQVRQLVSSSDDQYVVGVLFDDAFDHLWWLCIFEELRHRDCPANLARLIAAYLTNRCMELRGNYNSHTKGITKGYPQVSILGPNLWNLVLDSLLRDLARHAIAIDLLVIVSGNTKATT